MVEILLYASIPLVCAALFVAIVWALQLRRRSQLTGRIWRLGLFRGPLLISLCAMFLGLGVSVYYAESARQTSLEEAQNRFLQQASQVASGLQTRIDELGHLLVGVRGLFLASGEVSPQEFRDFAQSAEVSVTYGGVRGIGFIAREPRTAAAGLVARQRNRGWPDFALQTSGAAADLMVIEYLEPALANIGAIGYDIGSERLRRMAAEAAMRTGQLTLTRPIRLVQDERKLPGFLLLLPVYAQPQVPGSETERVKSLRGWAYVPLVLSELLRVPKGFDLQLTTFQLFDSPGLDAASLVYDSAIPSGDVQADASLVRYRASRFAEVQPLHLAGQTFYLRTHSSAAFEAGYHPRSHLQAATLGSALSVLASMVLWLLMAGRARALDLARGMTQDLERLSMVARGTSNAVFFTDTDWNITWVNEGFTRLSGYSEQEALGRRPSALLHSPLGDRSVKDTIDRAAEAGRRVQVQVLQRSKQGKDFWVDVEVVPLLGANGAITGYLSVQSDITEELGAKAALVLEKERAENVLSGTNVGTWESNLLTGEQRWNDRWGAMMGFARDEVVPGADQFWQQRLHPADRDRLNQAMADCIAGRIESYSCEVRVMRKDGSWMWILSRAKVMSRTRVGTAEWIGGIHNDITEFKQVELSLRDMEAFLDRAGRIAAVGAWQIDLQTRAMVFSAQTCAIHGMAPGFAPSEEVALSFYPPTDRQRLHEAMQKAELQGTPWDLVLEFNNAQGETLWVRNFGEIGSDDAGPSRLVGAFQDVTRDRLSQLEVERSNNLLRGAIEAINEAFVLFDPQDRLVFCNDKYRAIYAKSADLMVVGASFESIVRGAAARGQFADVPGGVDAWVAERIAVHNAGNMSVEQRLDDGRWLKVIDRCMPDGHRVGFRVDITELKQATAAAESISARRAEEQRRLQSILEGTRVGTWEWNVQTGESIYSEQYATMLGYTLAELEPQGYASWVRLVHPEDLPLSDACMQRHLDAEQPDYAIEVRVRHKQGHWIWVLAKGKLASRTEDGRALWVYGTHMDITERKLAEQQLAHTTAMLQNVLDSATAVGVVSLGLDHGIQVFNKGAQNLLGYDAQELVGRQKASLVFDAVELGALRETQTLVLGQEPGLEQIFEQVVQNREAQEWTLLRKNGSRFKASIIFSPMRDAQGVLVGNLAIIYDISRQKEYESTLREAMRLAEQSSVAKSQFLANMSHEIRTPMNAILGMLQLMHHTSLDAQQRDYTDKAVGAARSLLGLLNDILDFSKVEAGKMQLNPEPFQLESLLGDLSVILSSNLGAKPVDLLFEVDPAIPHELVGDALRLKQILINLAGNAVKFTEKGEVTIRWTLLARTPERVKLAVAVTDTGIGIAPENQARIFDAFTQAEANTTRRFGGTGLGLVISTRLIRLMGGELQLSSVLGQGSSFSFALELPVADFGRTPGAHLQAPPGQVRRVLLVDDNPHALAGSAAMLRALGWEVGETPSGAQALEWLQRDRASGGHLDALFVDADMPGMDGLETLRTVRHQRGSAQAPRLILLSRQSRNALAPHRADEHALLDGLLVRPLTASMFAAALVQSHPDAAVLQHQPTAQSGRLAGMRVLLVEDNAINQQVAQELLHAQGARVTLADNGALGLATLQQNATAFDVVLMDLQMPVMDGLSATRLLRADARFATLPVIAMTANAMRSDRDDCLAAGMNDHVGKPFDLQQLVQTLMEHTHWEVPNAEALPAPTQPGRFAQTAPANTNANTNTNANANANVQWPEGFEVEQALARLGGDQALLQHAMAAYVEDARHLPQRLAQGLGAGEQEQVLRELHAFKGLSATIGVPELAALALKAEQRLRASDGGPEFQQALDQFQQRLQLLLPTLERVAHQLAPQPDAQPQPGPGLPIDAHAKTLMRALLSALQASDMGAMELHAHLRQHLNGEQSATLEPLEQLDKAMADLDFAQAALECEKLVRRFDTIG